MRFGVCAPLEKVDVLAEVGYDYIELIVQDELMPEADDTEFQQIRDRVAEATIKPEAYAYFIPGYLRVVGDTVDLPRLSDYVETACRRAKAIGGEIIVYGSCHSRNLQPSD
ncbi:MAG: xylose isomerase, partial [Candidatus Poribacteria bacterium]|nr:xylose isomerase [Candidatus Poribacteria bacterium]